MSTPPTKRIPAGAVTPNGDQTNSEVGHHVGTSVPHDGDIPTLNTMNGRGRRIALSYFEAGRAEGWAAGWDAAQEDMAALWRQAHAAVQQVARQPDYAVLADRRGDHHRAAKQRQLLTERGVA